MRRPGLRRDLAEPGADLGARSRASINSRATSATASRTKSSSRPSRVLRDDIGNRRHALTFGHRGVSFTSTAVTADEFGATVADPRGPRPTRRSSHHFYRRDPSTG